MISRCFECVKYNLYYSIMQYISNFLQLSFEFGFFKNQTIAKKNVLYHLFLSLDVKGRHRSDTSTKKSVMQPYPQTPLRVSYNGGRIISFHFTPYVCDSGCSTAGLSQAPLERGRLVESGSAKAAEHTFFHYLCCIYCLNITANVFLILSDCTYTVH